MLHLIYNAAMYCYQGLIACASLWNNKARWALIGRKQNHERALAWRKINPQPVIWFHCASLGEFEQGRPLIEAFRSAYPGWKIVLTFFSPSGFEIRKNYAQADYVSYLPLDIKPSIRPFVKAIKPQLVVVIKYEFWVNWFQLLHDQSIPLFIISAKLRENQRFFGTFGFWWQKTLRNVSFFYTQDEQTSSLLSSIAIEQHTMTGDTRFDRVSQIKANRIALPQVEAWCGNAPVVVIGSSWSHEKEIAMQLHRTYPEYKIILVPHEVHVDELQALASAETNAVLYSALAQNHGEGNLMLVDTTGILSSLYALAHVTVIGGGFGKGIHNTLEAAVWGKPVIFGPRFEKFAEAKELIRHGAAISCATPSLMKASIEALLGDPSQCAQMGAAAAQYVAEQAGATKKILQHPEFQKALKN
jgi:3-deoxy-D-manno-octulosonic-acid transferase